MRKAAGNAERYSFAHIEPAEDYPMKGKNLCILGSSVAYGENSLKNGPGEYFASRWGCNLTKETVSGTTLADTGEKSYVQRVRNNIDPSRTFDLFICQLSTNDATKKIPLGEISESRKLSDFDTSTVTGAMEYIICYAKNTWNCPVVFFTGSRYESPAYGAMAENLKKLQAKWGIGILDLWSGDEFNAISDADRALYMTDDIHPTMAGYRDWWGPEMEKQLLKFLEASCF